MTNGDIRPEDYATFKRVSDEGRLRLIDDGVGLDPNLLWFNLSARKARIRRAAGCGKKAFRQAISCAVDRQAIVEHGLPRRGDPDLRAGDIGEPHLVCGRAPDVRTRSRKGAHAARVGRAHGSQRRRDARGCGGEARAVLESSRRPTTFGARVVAVVQEQLRQVGLAVDVVPLDPGALFQRDWPKATTTASTSASRPARPTRH